MRLFDTHAHLQFAEFDGDRDTVLRRAREAGVVGLLVLGTDVASSEAAVALANAEPDVMAAAGCHPHEARTMDEPALARLTDLAQLPEVAVVGEIGLDFYRNLSPRDRQIDVFQHQLETAAQVGKPVAIHCREAADALSPIVERWSAQLNGRLPDGRPLGVMHYFSGDAELAHQYVGLGFLISIHCSVTYPNARQLQEVARRLPLDALVVETDSPYGPPQSRRGQRNEPACVSEAVAKIADLRGESSERVAEITTKNAFSLFDGATTAPAALGASAQRGA